MPWRIAGGIRPYGKEPATGEGTGTNLVLRPRLVYTAKSVPYRTMERTLLNIKFFAITPSIRHQEVLCFQRKKSPKSQMN
jgi:hypothetical protein